MKTCKCGIAVVECTYHRDPPASDIPNDRIFAYWNLKASDLKSDTIYEECNIDLQGKSLTSLRLERVKFVRCNIFYMNDDDTVHIVSPHLVIS